MKAQPPNQALYSPRQPRNAQCDRVFLIYPDTPVAHTERDGMYGLERFQAGCSGIRENSDRKSRDFRYMLPLNTT
jgi:hypothetical protein